MAIYDLNAGTLRSDVDILTFPGEDDPRREEGFAARAGGFTPAGGSLYFSAEVDDAFGRELYVYDAAADTASLVTDLIAGNVGSSPSNLTESGGRLYFQATTSGGSGVLHQLDPATDAITQVGTLPLRSALFTRAGSDSLYFESPDGNRNKLFVYSTRTGQTTEAVGQRTFTDTQIESTATLGDTLYYVRSSIFDGDDAQLWAIDDAAQTAQARTERRGTSIIRDLTAYDGALYFAANQPSGSETDGVELYRYDPATGASTLVADLNAGAEGSEPQALTVAGGSLYFTATTPGTGRELYRYDAASDRTQRVSDIASGPNDSITGPLHADGTTLYFSAQGDDGLGFELWQYDTTQPVNAVRPAGALDVQLRLFPNPARDAATLTVEQAMGEQVTIDLHDVLGRRVARIHDGMVTSPDARFDVPTRDLSAGLYFVVVRSPSGTRTQSLTVVR